MADKDISIKITTAADIAGADAAATSIKKVSEATEEQAKATEKLEQSADQARGFKSLFDQQRLQAIGREMEKLGANVRGLVTEFSKTEAGREFFSELSEEAREFGGIALKTGAEVAQGWAQGGPIGAALAGINVLIKEVGDSFVAVAKAEEDAARSFQAEQDRLIKQTRERKELATDRAVEDSFRREGEYIGDQTQALENQMTVLAARRAFQKADRDAKDKEDLANGMSEEEVRTRRIGQDAIAERAEIQQKEFLVRDAALKQELAVERQERKVLAEGKMEGGTSSDGYRGEMQKLQAEKDRLADLQAKARTAAEVRDYEIAGLDRRTFGEYQDERGRNIGNATRDTERKAREREAEERQATGRRQGLGREGAGLANSAAGAVASRSERAARQLEELGAKFDQNPTGEAADLLGKTVERFANSLEGRDAATARKLREIERKFERVEAALKKIRTP